MTTTPARKSSPSRHNLGTVVGFEFFRTTKKPRFWIATLAIPVVMAIIFGLIFISNSSTSASANAQKNAALEFSYTDRSGIIPDQVAAAMGGTKAVSSTDGAREVKEGRLDAFFAFPANPATEAVQVYGADRGVFENGKYEAVA